MWINEQQILNTSLNVLAHHVLEVMTKEVFGKIIDIKQSIITQFWETMSLDVPLQMQDQAVDVIFAICTVPELENCTFKNHGSALPIVKRNLYCPF